MARCILHPGRESLVTVCGRNYCGVCRDGITAARGRVDRHVEPKECFIWYQSNDNWQPITGTGCAHWVAHQLNVQHGSSGERCMAGYTYRVRTLIVGRHQVSDLSQVRVNDIYVTPSVDHTGMVIRITPPIVPNRSPTIIIRHDSSAQHGVKENDFATYFHGQGRFYR